MLRSSIFTDAERIARATIERLRDGLGGVRANGSGRAAASAPPPGEITIENETTGATVHKMLWGVDAWGDPDARWNDF